MCTNLHTGRCFRSRFRTLFFPSESAPPANSSNTFAQGSRCHQKEAVFRYAQKPFYALVSGLLPLRHLIVCEQSSAAIRALTPLNFRSRFRTLCGAGGYSVFFVDLSSGLLPPISAHKRCIARNHAEPPHIVRKNRFTLWSAGSCRSDI